MNTTQRELLHSQTSAENFDTVKQQYSEIIERIPVENTPFTIVGTENRWMVSLGQYQLTRWYHTKEEAANAITSRDYELLFAMMQTAIEGWDIMQRVEAKIPGFANTKGQAIADNILKQMRHDTTNNNTTEEDLNTQLEQID